MKNLFKINLALVLTLFLVTSCSKNKDADEQKEKVITAAEMQNTFNPFDEQGIMYKGFLNTIASDSDRFKEGGIMAEDDWEAPQIRKDIGGWDVGQIAAFNGDIGGWDVGQIAAFNGDIGGWDVGQILSFAMRFNSTNGKDSSDLARRNLSMQLEAFSGMNMADIEDECWYHPSRCKKFINAVQILEPSNGGTAHDRTIKYINAVRDLEAKVQGDVKINQAEKDAFLISYSIARHAAGYWYNISRNSNEPVGKITTNMVHLSTLGSSTAFFETDTKEVGVGTALLSAYIATGRAN